MADQFIKFQDVKGESQQKGFEDWIELSSFSMSSATSGSTSLGGGSGVGKPSIHGVSFSTVAGRHTPTIMKRYFEGKHFEKVEVKFIKQTGADAAETYYHLTMQHVFVTSMQAGKGEGSLGSESMSLTAESYKQEYFAQEKDGTIKSVGSTTYNEKTGVSS